LNNVFEAKIKVKHTFQKHRTTVPYDRMKQPTRKYHLVYSFTETVRFSTHLLRTSY